MSTYETGPQAYQRVLYVFAGPTAAFAFGTALAVIDRPGRMPWQSVLQCMSALLMLGVSLVATANGSRAAVWRFSVADILFGGLKGPALVLLAAMSSPARTSAWWSFVAAMYAAAVVLHLRHVRVVAVEASRAYRAHLRAAQRGATVLAIVMTACFGASFVAESVGSVVAPAFAATLGVLALRSESLIARLSPGIGG